MESFGPGEGTISMKDKYKALDRLERTGFLILKCELNGFNTASGSQLNQIPTAVWKEANICIHIHKVRNKDTKHSY